MDPAVRAEAACRLMLEAVRLLERAVRCSERGRGEAALQLAGRALALLEEARGILEA